MQELELLCFLLLLSEQSTHTFHSGQHFEVPGVALRRLLGVFFCALERKRVEGRPLLLLACSA